MNYIGIDPGWSGGIAVIRDFRPVGEYGTVSLFPMPENIDKMANMIRSIYDCYHDEKQSITALELVSGYVGGKGDPGSAMFTFGENYGMLKMALAYNGIAPEIVHPHTWQSELGIEKRRKEESKAEWKRRLKAVAQETFPYANITLKTCDAALIARYLYLKCCKATAVTGPALEAKAI